MGINLDADHYRIPMSEQHRKALNQWFLIWFREGERLLCDAINADDSIVAGKQWVFDHRPKLGDHYREVAGQKFELSGDLLNPQLPSR